MDHLRIDRERGEEGKEKKVGKWEGGRKRGRKEGRGEKKAKGERGKLVMCFSSLVRSRKTLPLLENLN